MAKTILDLCGGTGAWSKPYLEHGYNVINITLPDYDILNTEIRYQYGDMIFKGNKNLLVGGDDIYGILAAPPCTMFSFARAKAKTPRNLEGAMKIVYHCLRIIWAVQYETEFISSKKTTLKFWALENPSGMLKYFLGKPAFEFHPDEFGDGYKKRTSLWGWFNEPRKAYEHDSTLPKFASNQPISFRMNPKLMSITPTGFAEAFFKANK